MAPPSVAIVGTGSMASAMTAAFARASVPIRAVVSRDEGRAVKFVEAFGGELGTSDLSAVLAREDVQAVYIANSPADHAATVIMALRAGKAVLCEKPMATSVAEMSAIIEAAEQTGVLCMEAIWTLCLPAYRHFFALARSGEWGEAKSLTASFAYPAFTPDLERLESRERGGVLLDRGIYLIALAVSLFGPVEKTSAQLSFNPQAVDTEAFLLLRHQNGAHAQLATSFDRLMPNSAELHCARGMIELQAPLIGSESISISRSVPRSSPPSGESSSFGAGLKPKLRQSSPLRRLKRLLDGPATHQRGFGAHGHLGQLEHFLDLVARGGRQSDIVPLSLSLEIIRVIDRAKEIAARS